VLRVSPFSGHPAGCKASHVCARDHTSPADRWICRASHLCSGNLDTAGGGHAGYTAAIGFLGEADIDYNMFDEDAHAQDLDGFPDVNDDGLESRLSPRRSPSPVFDNALALSDSFTRRVARPANADDGRVRVCK